MHEVVSVNGAVVLHGSSLLSQSTGDHGSPVSTSVKVNLVRFNTSSSLPSYRIQALKINCEYIKMIYVTLLWIYTKPGHLRSVLWALVPFLPKLRKKNKINAKI